MTHKILGLRTTIYKVTDLKAAIAWYTKAFNQAPYFDEPFYVGFNIGGYELGLQEEKIAPETKVVNVESYWGVEDIEGSYQRFLELGATVHQAPMNVGGPLMVAIVKDPWGNAIGLIYNPVFKLN